MWRGWFDQNRRDIDHAKIKLQNIFMCKSRLIVAILFTQLLLLVSAQAKIEVSKQQLDNGTRFILISGSFEPFDDPQEFQHLVSLYSPKFVTFDSGGGTVQTAMEYGRTIRRNGLMTIQARSNQCASACSLAFMGGTIRLAEPGSIGLHQGSYSDGVFSNDAEAVSAVQKATAKIIRYMVEMGVDPSILEVGLNYGPEDMRYLSASEMKRYRMTTEATKQPETHVSRQPEAQSNPEVQLTGLTRHPNGNVILRTRARKKSSAIQTFPNGVPVKVFGEKNRWYYAEIQGIFGYVHSTSVKIDQFVDGGFENKFIQIKSFPSLEEVQEFSRSSGRKVAGYLATNGWYAVTLNGTYKDSEATTLLKYLKSSGRIPDDSFKTYGNTYVKRVCCN